LCDQWRAAPPHSLRRSNGFDDDEIPWSIQATNENNNEFWFAGSDSNTAVVQACWGSCYGIRTYNNYITASAPNAAVTDANDYQKVMRVGNTVFFFEAGRAENPFQGFSNLRVMAYTDVAQFDAPPPVVVGYAADWLDFDVLDLNNVYIGAASALYLASNASSADGSWTLTAYYGAYNIVGVGISQSRSTVFVTTADSTGASALWSFDVASGTYNNNGAALATTAPGYQWRGIAMAPMLPSSTPTVTPTASITPSNSASGSPTASTTPTSTASLSQGATPTGTPTSTAMSTITPSASGTASSTASPSVTATATRRSGFGTTGFAITRVQSSTYVGPSGSESSVTLQSVYIDDYSGCTTAGPCTPVHSWTLPNKTSSGVNPCTLTSYQENGRLSRSANGALLTLYCFKNATGTSVGATYYRWGDGGEMYGAIQCRYGML
jgi:hypothetical protein